ncbi:MAG: ATP-binding protein [Flavobacteriales bacterium]|jgi:hypothetical protein|nr:ATP-binding protein [Flavobacteriales bacterium]
MAKEVTTAKQSSGAGFLFEDKVFSWFAVAFLAQRFPLSNIFARISRIVFQARAEGWLLDDLVLTMKTESNDTFSIPTSVKSNVQFTGNGPNAELLSDLWEQYLNEESTVFDRQNDYLCVVNSPLSSSLSTDINKLIKAAQSSTSDILEARILQGKSGSFSESQVKLVHGFRCPSALATKHNIEDKEVWALLSRVILLEFDFEYATSRDELQLKLYCKNCLSEADDSQADLLYTKLCETRSELAANEGAFINYETLISRLRPHFKLKGIPQHEDDWEKIITYSSTKCDSIQDQIGGRIKLEREKELTDFKETIKEGSFSFLLGKSGYGKSVLLKHFFQELSANKIKAIWIDSDITDSRNLKEFYGLLYPFIEVIQQVQDQEGYIIIDSIERFRKEEHLKLLFNILTYIDNNQTPWKVIFSCQTDDFDDLIKRFYRVNLSFSNKVFYLDAIESEKQILVQKEFPALADLFKHNHLNTILKNLKYLDLLAFNLSSASNIEVGEPFGESDIIDLIWKEEVENPKYDNGEQRSRFLQLISENQAEKMTVNIPQSDFDIAELAPLPSLKTSKILRAMDDKLLFEHDLFSDWARYKLIKGNNENFKSYITSKNILSPLWGKSIRLYGVFLLEKNGNVDDWIKTFSELNESIPNEKIIQDLLLESIIYSNSALRFLDLLLDFFTQDDGKVLRRFLDRFLVKATRPNPQVLKLAKELGGYSESEASTYQRIPIFLYWPPVIDFVKKNIDIFTPLAGSKIADLAQTWLDFAPNTFPYRKEVSFCAFKNAEWIFNFKLNKGWVSDGLDKKVYKSMLAGINELPEEILELCLKLCRRTKFQKPEKEKPKVDVPEPKSIFAEAEIRKPKQWEHGPFERVDEAFSETCLSTDALSKLVTQHPEKAKEIILALLIDPPRPISFGYDYNYKYDVVEPRGWFPPYYGRGPLLNFLSIHPYSGIDTIINLVDFATSQWANVETYNKRHVPTLEIVFEEKKVFTGDHRIYFWYRSSGNAPHTISSALMALEKFLTNSIDEGKDIEPFIEHILKSANSVCFIGLLSFIGKYQSSLLFGILHPLLSAFDLYRWEMTLDSGASNIEGHQMIGTTDLGEKVWNEVRDWNNLKYRKISITSAGLQIYLQTNQLNDFYKKTVEFWKGELQQDEKDGEIDAYKRNLIAQFNKENYRLKEFENQKFLEYVEPKELEEKLVPLRNTDSQFFEKTITPFRYSREIEEGKTYTKDEVVALWEKVFSEAEIPLSPEKYHHLAYELSSLFGAIALLYEHQNLWLEEHPEYIDWTIDYTEKVLIKAPSRLNDLYMAGGIDSWDTFIARFLPELWAKDLRNKKIRKSLGLLCLKSTYDTNEVLFRNVANELNWHHQDFIQLQNLIIQWSIGVYRFFKTQNKEELPPVYKETIFQKLIKRIFKKEKDQEVSWIDIYAHKILEEFISDKTTKEIVNWSEERMITAHVDHHSWGRNKEKENNRKAPGLDMQMLQHAFSSIPELSEVSDDSEYQYLLSLWDQIVEQLIFENGNITPNCEVNDEYPRDFNLWALERISKLVVRIKKEDDPSRYWKPILKYGGFTPYQNDVFLRDFFIYNIGDKELQKKFFEEWEQMVEFCTQCENWKKGNSWRRTEYEPSLYGVSHSLISIWNDDYEEFLEQASEKIITWFAKNFYNHDLISRLILLLRKKSGIVLLTKGVAVLKVFVRHHTKTLSKPAPEGHVHRQFEYNESLARTASYLWENHGEALKRNTELYGNFKEIVTYLVSVHEPIGLELQNRILES